MSTDAHVSDRAAWEGRRTRPHPESNTHDHRRGRGPPCRGSRRGLRRAAGHARPAPRTRGRSPSSIDATSTCSSRLTYQIATGALSPREVAYPLRTIFKRRTAQESRAARGRRRARAARRRLPEWLARRRSRGRCELRRARGVPLGQPRSGDLTAVARSRRRRSPPLRTSLSEYHAMTRAPAAVAQSRMICISRDEGQVDSGRPHDSPHISAHDAACVTAQNGLP
jgi:hypothetical protein